jgi:uncharacterized membrane protein
MAQPSARARAGSEIEFSRVVAFSDGVFAIAMTLLVLGLEVPQDASSLGDALLDQDSSLWSYALSFAVLAKLWLDHHELYSGFERFDRRLMTLNLVYLAWVALVPFTSNVLGDYGADSVAVAVYAASIAGVALTLNVQLTYAYRHGMLRDDAREVARREWAPGGIAAALVFLVSIPVAVVNPVAGMATWVLALPIGDRLGEPFARRTLGE